MVGKSLQGLYLFTLLRSISNLSSQDKTVPFLPLLDNPSIRIKWIFKKCSKTRFAHSVTDSHQCKHNLWRKIPPLPTAKRKTYCFKCLFPSSSLFIVSIKMYMTTLTVTDSSRLLQRMLPRTHTHYYWTMKQQPKTSHISITASQNCFFVEIMALGYMPSERNPRVRRISFPISPDQS